MAFLRCGGGGDVLPVFGQQPDKYFFNETAGTSGTHSIPVTKKPRYLVYEMWSRTSNYYGFTGIVDVANNKAWRIGYMASGIVNAEWTNWTNFFTTVSSSSVVYAYNALSYNARVGVHVYY